MQRIFGNRERIDLSRSEFRVFIEEGNLYVDKTRFIAHVIDEPSNVLLFTRPRRSGKSLNLDMLRTFFDCKLDTKGLFKGLYIESQPVFDRINSCPVIYLNFKELRADNYKEQLREMLHDAAMRYLDDSQIDMWVRKYFDYASDSTGVAGRIVRNIHEAYGVKPYVLIDEYDKILMDNLSDPEYETIRDWLKNVFESSFKDNHHLGKCIMVGVTRVSQEGLLSGLNNIKILDVFFPSVYDGDFSLTEEEAAELLEKEQLEAAREWYNNYRVGNKKLYTMFSVLSYMEWGVLDNYWGMSGTMDMLMEALNAERTDAITDLLSEGREIEAAIKRRMSLRQLRSGDLDDGSFYSFAVQAGYLTYEKMPHGKLYKISLPNRELHEVWEEFILEDMLKSRHTNLKDIFKKIKDTALFCESFEEFINFQLSCYDTGKELEKTYHVLVFGLILGAGFKCSSNRERGYGRYDLWLESPEFNVIIEFKRAKKETEDLEELASAAIEQINKKKYYTNFPKTIPLYKVGVGCFKTECSVTAESHDFG